jgi:lipopolysaccharide biosynthesis glycosyltransferase
MRENCIITFGKGANYPRGVDRLKEFIIKNKVNCDFYGYKEYPKNVPTHEEIPYGFKYFMMLQKIKEYKRVIWIDSSFICLSNLEELWQHIDKYGYLVYRGTHPVSSYTTNKMIEAFELRREDISQYYSCAGGIFGVNTSVIGMKLLNDMCHYAKNTCAYMKDGNSRYDQSVLSLLCYKHNALEWRNLLDETYVMNKHIKEKFNSNDLSKYKNKIWILDRQYVKKVKKKLIIY